MGLLLTAAGTAGIVAIVSWIKKRMDESQENTDSPDAQEQNAGQDATSQEDKEILAMWQEAAQKGDPQAQFNMGNMYYAGEAVPQDYAKALFWYENAAMRGLAEAQAHLGNMYHLGQGVPRDLAKAREWWEKAAAQGDSMARSMLILYR